MAEFRILVAEPVAAEGIAALRKAADVDLRTGLSPAELLAAIPEYEGLVVRSATQVNAELITAAKRMLVIGRAGAGVDNIDVDAATERGIVVINTPSGNTVSAAELAVGLLLALSRHLAGANASLRSGKWERQRFIGSELHGKTAAIVGLGQVGSAVARRLQALEMRVIAHDPFVPAERAAALGVDLCELNDLLADCDVLTLHTPASSGGAALIGAREIELMRPGAVLINAARGTLIDEAALLAALDSGKLSGAALDVFAEEPAVGNALIDHPRVLATPHLGASTQEAQERVAVDLAVEMLRVLRGEPALNAVNAPFIDPETLEAVGPYLEVAAMCGRLCTQLARGQWREVRVHYHGAIASHDVLPIKAAVFAGLLAPISDLHVNMVSVNDIIAQHGWRVLEELQTNAEPYQSTVTVELATSAGRFSLTGTHEHGRAAVVEIDGFPVHVPCPRRGGGPLHLLVLRNEDRPGRIGAVGLQLGAFNINIRAMEVGHDEERPSEDSLMALTINRPLNPNELQTILEIDGIDDAKQATI